MASVLLVGLGNPGPRYADTRHNAGAWFIQTLSADCYGQSLTLNQKHKGLMASCKDDNHHDIKLYIPQSYMNECGPSIRAVAQFYKVPASSLLIVHDELDLKPGTVKWKAGGGHAGHNGLRDIIRHMGCADFFRLRLGIGHPGCKDKVSDYVLSTPSREDKISIEGAIHEGLALVKTWINNKGNGPSKLENRENRSTG